MLNQYIADILINRIITGGLNPKTGNRMTVNDIVKEDYKQAVQAVLDIINQEQGE